MTTWTKPGLVRNPYIYGEVQDSETFGVLEGLRTAGAPVWFEILPSLPVEIMLYQLGEPTND